VAPGSLELANWPQRLQDSARIEFGLQGIAPSLLEGSGSVEDRGWNCCFSDGVVPADQF
jgi:hypothetical protein